MNKEELAKQYADKKVAKKGQYIDCDFDVRKELTVFNGYDIEQSYEDGYDKAVELACQYIKDNLYKYLFVCDGQAGFPTAEFIKYIKSAMENKL